MRVWTHLRRVSWAALLWACSRAQSGSPSGRLRVSWTGADSGRFEAPAAGGWCASQHRLEVTAVRGDTGFGLVIYPIDTLTPGAYPAFDAADSMVTRPGAAVAARWFTETTIQGYRADSGTVSVSLGSRAVGGQFSVHMLEVAGGKVLKLQGTFGGVSRGTATEGCPGDGPGQGPAPGVN